MPQLNKINEQTPNTDKLGISLLLGVACLATSGSAAAKAMIVDYNARGTVTLSDPAYSAGAMLTTIRKGATSGDMTTVINGFNGLSAAQTNTEVRKAAPAPNVAVSSPSIATGSASIGLSESRLASLRDDSSLATSGVSGMSAGDTPRNSAFWVKGLGGVASQDAKDGFDGYKAKIYGIGFGADTRLQSDWTVGLSFTYGQTKIDQQDFRAGDTNKVSSNQLTAYAGRDFGAAYLDVLLGYSDMQFDTKRATALGRTATGSYGGDVWLAKIGGGYRMALAGGNSFIPTASLQHARLTQNAYTETGAGALSLSYESQTTSRTQSNLGFRFTNDSKTDSGGDVKLEGRLGWLHDFRDNATDTTAAFTGGGGAFVTNGQKITKNGWTVGAGAEYKYRSAASVSVQYDHEGRNGYKADTVQLIGRWPF